MIWPSLISFALKYIWQLIVGLLLLFFGVYLWWTLIHNPAKNAAVAAKGQTIVHEADLQSAHDAVQTVTKNADATRKVEDLVRKNHARITQAKGADVKVSDDVDYAGRDAICLHDSAARLPECIAMQQPSP